MYLNLNAVINLAEQLNIRQAKLFMYYNKYYTKTKLSSVRFSKLFYIFIIYYA